MANTAEAEQPMPEPIEAEHEGKPTVEQAIDRVTNFVDSVYGPNIPPKVRERVLLLKAPNTVIQDQRVFEEKRDQTHQYKPEHVRNIIAGFYSPQDDQVFLPDVSSVHDMTHEMLHFVSSYHQNGTVFSGIQRPIKFGKVLEGEELSEAHQTILQPESYDYTGKKPNEALTEILTILLDSGIDINDKQSFKRLASFIENKKNQAELQVSAAYRDYIMNTLSALGARFDTSRILGEIAANYLAGDKEGFERTLYKRSGLLAKVMGQQSTLSDFFHDIGITAAEEKENISLAFQHVAKRLDGDQRISSHIKSYVKTFVSALDGKECKVKVLHPELNPFAHPDGRKDVEIIPGSVKGGQQGSPASIIIDSSLWNSMLPIERENGTEADHAFTYLCQAEGYLLWQGYKLAYLRKSGIKFDLDTEKYVDRNGQEAELPDDGEILENPVIREFLRALTPEEFTEVIYSYRKTLSYIPASYDTIDDLVQSRQDPPGQGFTKVPSRLLPEQEKDWGNLVERCVVAETKDEVLKGNFYYYLPENGAKPEKLHGR